MIFGIFGKFGIDIGDPKKIGRKKIVEKNIKKDVPKKKWSKKIDIFLLDHLFRSQIFQRFQKSYLEQRAII